VNYPLIATEIGDLVKYDTTVNSIDRAARSIFRFAREDSPNTAITSSRAQLIYDWILSLAKQSMEPSERNALLIQFCRSTVPPPSLAKATEILERGGVPTATLNREELVEFTNRGFHPEVHKHSKKLFLDGYYFHAVFEACKAYNRSVQDKAQSSRDGQALMLEVWPPEGVLKLTKCVSDTDKNVQHGIKFLSAGLMQAVRNPTAHEPALDWPIKKEDCLDLLSFISFLFRQLDAAVYFKPP
jgi:uncharacterized protein (TIGR02391 family)